MKLRKILIGIVTLSIISNQLIYADEITISGNGGGDNTVVVNSSQNTTVDQSNNAQINNNVAANTDTGNNQASQNTGDATINTGNANISSNVTNENINQSSVQTGCCQADTSLNISGNGAGSDNTIVYNTSSNTNTSINNNANINNNVHGTANTGNNKANNNLGSVSIATGNIYVSDTIHNASINVYNIKGSAGNGGSVYIALADNGVYSNNSVYLTNNNNTNANINSNANIVNNSVWDLNTGNNEANKNNGDVDIATGDIVFASTIENTDINVGWVDIECCEQPKGGPNPPPDGNPPPPPPSINPGPCIKNCVVASSSPSSNPGSGQPVLPVTGSDTMFFLMIGNILMFFLGGYLRLRSGRSPNYLFAK